LIACSVSTTAVSTASLAYLRLAAWLDEKAKVRRRMREGESNLTSEGTTS